jgi:DNA-binding CsgD family transcriptional regulator
MKFVWTEQKEKEVLTHRAKGISYIETARIMGSTISSVKHKVRRLQQSANMDRYKHSKEKISQISHVLGSPNSKINTLETHCGFGGLTEIYNNYGNVLCYDIKKDRVDYVKNLNLKNVFADKKDSEDELYNLVYRKRKFDVVDIDPYGYPSRFFPHVFQLIDNGYLFLTFPVMGVAQINKITIQHLISFWNISLSDKDFYIEKVISKLFDYAFMSKRKIDILSVEKIDRIYRLAIKVKKTSLCEIVGLTVNR